MHAFFFWKWGARARASLKKLYSMRKLWFIWGETNPKDPKNPKMPRIPRNESQETNPKNPKKRIPRIPALRLPGRSADQGPTPDP